ncbi:type VI secretion system-associated FHA domain protein TagH [Reyranella sp.]|uniref:type VI secretion system-associated FHA domain protein TagH n=1 Tax=Reyranella sp. TaxID=1929291 RepID=UPI003D1012C0
MTLKLVMIRCPDDVAPERREVRGGEFSIGRAKDNQWVVADAGRHLSKKHCQLIYGAGEWELRDLSTNGTFINNASDPIGKGASQKLRHGDRIKFGLYEIEVSLDEDPAAPDHDRFAAYDRGGSADLPSRSELPPYHGGRSSDSASMTDLSGSPILPADFDPLAPGPAPFAGPTEPDHAPALQSAFRPPQPLSIIPDDWDVDLPAAGQRLPTPRPHPAQQPSEGAVPPDAPATNEAPRPATRAAAPMPGSASDSDVTAALLRGLGLGETALRDPEKTMESLGAAARATVSGLRQILMARASIKDEFRIEQTVIRPSGNNPLKFSLDDDDALATLLGIGRSASMPAVHAITEAFDDLRMHELATISAMQAAVRVLLAQFDPDSIERNAGSGGLQIHPAQKKARAWEAFAQLHGKVTQALSDDFDSVFGKAFARAYEQAIEKLDAEKERS